MLLILEIALVIWAWKRGWKGWALLPILICAGVSFMYGFIMGGLEISIEGLDAYTLLFDLGCIAALIGMIAKPRKTASITQHDAMAQEHQEHFETRLS
jgi:hypothetical protein